VVLHGVQPIRPPLCSEVGLSELSGTVCQLTPSAASACPPLSQGTSIGPSSSCRWGCSRHCPFIPGVVQPLFPVESVLHRGHSCCLLWVVGSQPCAAMAAVARTIILYACHSAFGSEYALFSVVSRKVHWHCVLGGTGPSRPSVPPGS
jgi:hypothetical protein